MAASLTVSGVAGLSGSATPVGQWREPVLVLVGEAVPVHLRLLLLFVGVVEHFAVDPLTYHLFAGVVVVGLAEC